MNNIVLNENKEEYPCVFLPSLVIDHIFSGYSEEAICRQLNVELPKKENKVKEKVNLDYRLHTFLTLSRDRSVELKTILNLDYNSIHDDLETYVFSLGNYELPIKPKMHSESKVYYRDYNEIIENTLRSLILIPIIGFFTYMALGILVNPFLSFEEWRNFPIMKTVTITSLVIYFFGYAYGISKGMLKKKVRFEKTLLEKGERMKLLDNYKKEVKTIVKKYNRNYDKRLKEIKYVLESNSESAEIDILKERISEESKVGLRNIPNPQRGKSELFFLKHLYEVFERNVFIDYAPDVGNNPFQPDFIVRDNDLGLHLDIEIDEPYSLVDGKTIHHDRTKDGERNTFFNNLNWGVIRFTEKQILKSPKKCVKLIQDTLEAVRKRKDFVKHDIEKEIFWTHEEALLMKLNNYRSSY